MFISSHIGPCYNYMSGITPESNLEWVLCKYFITNHRRRRRRHLIMAEMAAV